MAEELGQQMIVDYRPGAAGNIGAQAAARAEPDGYTIYLGARPNTIHKVMYENLQYDFARDLVPIGMIATMPYVLVTRTQGPIKQLQDLIALATAHPGAITCASSGVGTSDHLLCELFQQEAGVDMLHVPYRGNAQAIPDVIGGRVDTQFVPLPGALPHIRSGHLRGIAVMSRLRVAAIHHVPTIGELGMRGLDLEAWYGLMAPTGTPPHAVARLNRSINAILTDLDFQKALMQLAYMPPLQPNTSGALADFISEETERWTAILRERNIKPGS
jgi:tripartite-type tricarboxylate transporter receptor subunit TctC